jgi:DNA polymerase-3 subunit beta
VERDGSAVFPVKVVGDIFKKIPAKQFTVEVSEGSALITAGRNKYRFGTYRVEEFPRIPSPPRENTTARFLWRTASSS